MTKYRFCQWALRKSKVKKILNKSLNVGDINLRDIHNFDIIAIAKKGITIRFEHTSKKLK